MALNEILKLCTNPSDQNIEITTSGIISDMITKVFKNDGNEATFEFPEVLRGVHV